MASYLSTDKKKITATRFMAMKGEGDKIAMLTAYDFTMARLLDEAGVDAILIGDSASNVMIGNATTLPITLDQMIYHDACVANGSEARLYCGRYAVWYGTWRPSGGSGCCGAYDEGEWRGCSKGGGGVIRWPTLEMILDAGIPGGGSSGLTPQSVNKLGGYRVSRLRRRQKQSSCFRMLALWRS